MNLEQCQIIKMSSKNRLGFHKFSLQHGGSGKEPKKFPHH